MTQLDAPTAAVLGAIVGGGVAGLIAAISQWLTRRSEERRALRQLVMQAAIENWKHTAEAAKHIAASQRGGVTVYPLDGFIIHMLKLVEVLDAHRITPEDVRRIMREVQAVGDAAAEEIARHSSK